MKKQKISKNKENENAVRKLIKDYKKELLLLRDKQKLILIEENVKKKFKD